MAGNNPPIPAAQYLRMSTDDQPNSIPLQKESIRHYADSHGFEIIATYSDPGKSGIEIKHRPGLRKLIHDVVGGHVQFKVILVYDISRWGRFQDTDESAYYEFLCRKAGVPIHYCAEQFSNDGTMPNAIMKALKRTMAAEFSRELAVKVHAGQKRIAAQGFRPGGMPGFGLRRMLIGSDGRRKQILRPHERKNLTSDRVILVPGPKHEVECIRMIFDLAANKRKSPREIAEELNRRNVKFVGDKPWKKSCINNILKNEKYTGANVWGRSCCPFNTHRRRLPKDKWVKKNDAFVPLISLEQFTRVQKLMLKRKTYPRRPDSYLLDQMKKVLAKEGKLTTRLLIKYGFDGYRSCSKSFGSMMRAYQLIGYQPSHRAAAMAESSRKILRLRLQLLRQLQELFPSRLRFVRLSGQNQRQVAEIDNELQLAIHICRHAPPTVGGEPRWTLKGQAKERDLPALICIPNQQLTCIKTFYVVPALGDLIRQLKILRAGHPFLTAGKRLESLEDFCDTSREVITNWKPHDEISIVGDVVLNRRHSVVFIKRKRLQLPDVECAIFKVLVHNAGTAVTRETLREAAEGATRQGSHRYLGSNYFYISNCINVLRKRLKPFGNRVVTVTKKGYMYQRAETSERVSSVVGFHR
jgi:DNA invertase Pin-like site-specific DNA recombinase/DNA-binding winged helix-turn-helix (wHTH) protein